MKLGLFSGEQLIAQHAIDTCTFDAPKDAFLSAQSFASEQLMLLDHGKLKLSGVGLAMAGVIDSTNGVLTETANLQRWHRRDFLNVLKQVFDCHTYVINDATAAAVGEASQIAQIAGSLALVTLGTGVGSGIVINGQPWNGAHQCGGEIGHAPIEFGANARMCGCGKPGHVEAYCGAAGIVQTALELMARFPEKSSPLRDKKTISPLDIYEAAEIDDWVARQTIDWTGFYIGRALSLLAHTIDPAIILIGGAINFGGKGSAIGRRFLDNIRSEFARVSLHQLETQTVIEFASLGNRAGLFGAASFAFTNLKSSVSEHVR
jgi:glucokinase